MKVQPLGDNVVVKMVDNNHGIRGGIILPTKEKPQYAEVIAVARHDFTCQSESSIIKPGDKVIVDKYSGVEIKLNESEYIVVKMKDVLCVIESEGND